MRKLLLILFLASLCAAGSCYMQKERRRVLYELKNAITPIPGYDFLPIDPVSFIEEGNADDGYKYLVNGNAFNSGVPYPVYRSLQKIRNSTLGRIAGYTPYTMNDFVVFESEKGLLTATPGCLHCHAQRFNDSLIIGLGNSYSNFQSNVYPYLRLLERITKMKYGKNSAQWKTAEPSFEISRLLKGKVQTQMQGPTPAQKIAEIMASHHDPVTLEFRADTSYFDIPTIVIPEDVPALWISKKRKAMTVNAMRQGDFLKHITTPALLSLKDSSEARAINDHGKDVWAYIKTLQAPKYPYAIAEELAAKGKKVYLQNCASCHGTYDKEGSYPNKIIPAKIINTDSLLWKYFIKYPGYAEWYNKSWFAVSSSPSYTKPQAGYVPPPLDGVWITAPYLHNGSVPDIESVLNSKARPRYWKRDFNKQDYDYKKLGWKYKKLSSPGGRKTYNTDIPGYGNYGHDFGDHLSNEERKAVIEYLKTL